jgi:hypothetical protein
MTTLISTPAEQDIKTLLTDWWLAVNAQLAVVTGASVQIGDAPIDLLYGSEIGQRLARIAAVAECIQAAETRHDVYPWDATLSAQILDDCRFVETWLSQGPIFHRTPDEFWASPVGFRILIAKVWANQDQLITLGTAAEISGMSLSVLSQRMTRGQIPGYRDPKMKNPKHGRRVRLSDLHILMAETALRGALPPTKSLLPKTNPSVSFPSTPVS